MLSFGLHCQKIYLMSLIAKSIMSQDRIEQNRFDFKIPINYKAHEDSNTT